MAEIITYLRAVSAPIAPNTIVAPGAGDYSQELTFDFSTVTNSYNQQYFSKYTGDNNAPNYRFPIQSSCLIKALRLSIPNLPGSRFALDPDGAPKLIRQGFTIGVAGFTQPPVAPINAADYFIGVNQLEEWTPTNIVVDASLYQDGTADYFYLSFGPIGAILNQKVFVDFRNFQAIFNNINIYLLVELQVIAPAGVV